MPIAELYRQLTSFWDRARIDVVAHMLLAVVLMLAGYRLSLPAIELPDPQTILEHPWFKVLEKGGASVVILLVIGLFFALYGTVLHWLGGWIAGIASMVLPVARDTPREPLGLRRAELAAVAGTLGRSRVEPGEIRARFAELVQRYQAAQPDIFAKLSAKVGDRYALFRNACFFLVGWLLIQAFDPGLPHRVGLVDGSPALASLLIAGALLIAWWRMHAYLPISVEAMTSHVVGMIGNDPVLREARAKAESEEPAAFQASVDAAFAEFSRRRHRPSLLRWLAHRLRTALGLQPRTAPRPAGALRRWHDGVCDRGSAFARDRQYDALDQPGWLGAYAAWLYAATCRKLVALWGYARHLLRHL
ncbi:MAG: hypothetical protein AB7O45_12765 [Alphaproteobacteria bacterium]